MEMASLLNEPFEASRSKDYGVTKLQHETEKSFAEVQPRSETFPGEDREDLPRAGRTRPCRRKAGETRALLSALSPLTPKKIECRPESGVHNNRNLKSSPR